MSKNKARWIDYGDPNQRIPTKASPPPAAPPVWVAEIPAVTTVDCPDARYAPGPVTVRCFKEGIEPPQIKAPEPVGEWVNAMTGCNILGTSKAYFSVLAKRHNFTRKITNGNIRRGESKVLFNRAELEQHKASTERKSRIAGQ